MRQRICYKAFLFNERHSHYTYEWWSDLVELDLIDEFKSKIQEQHVRNRLINRWWGIPFEVIFHTAEIHHLDYNI